MIPDADAYSDLDHIDPGDDTMVAYWADRWGVTPLAIYAAIGKVGPLLRDVAVEVWKGG